jgi:hypothetical protein
MKYQPWLRHPKTTAEKKANQVDRYGEHHEKTSCCRGKRLPHNLPDAYDHYFVHKQKCWKKKRKKQYRVGSRGEHYIFETKSWRDVWELEHYFEDNDIPFRVDEITEVRQGVRYITEKRVEGKPTKKYHRIWVDGKYILDKSHQIGWKRNFSWVPLDKPIEIVYTYNRTVGYEVHYWTDKDIGIEFILKKIEE